MGFGTVRVTGKGLNKNGFSSVQEKGRNMLQGICGPRKLADDTTEALKNIIKNKKSDDEPHNSRLTAYLQEDDFQNSSKTTVEQKENNPVPKRKVPNLKNLL